MTRFLTNDIYYLVEIFQIPNQVRCYNSIMADGIEALICEFSFKDLPTHADMQTC